MHMYPELPHWQVDKHTNHLMMQNNKGTLLFYGDTTNKSLVS